MALNSQSSLVPILRWRPPLCYWPQKSDIEIRMKIAKLTAKWIFGCLENSQCCQWRPGQTEEIKSDTRHKTFLLSYTLATTTQAAIELKFINVLALVFYLINCSWRNQRHLKSLTPRNFHPRYFQSLSQFVSWRWFTSRSNFMFIVKCFKF